MAGLGEQLGDARRAPPPTPRGPRARKRVERRARRSRAPCGTGDRGRGRAPGRRSARRSAPALAGRARRRRTGRCWTGNGGPGGHLDPAGAGHACVLARAGPAPTRSSIGSVTPQQPNDTNARRTAATSARASDTRAAVAGSRSPSSSARSLGGRAVGPRRDGGQHVERPRAARSPSAVVLRTAWCSPAVSLKASRRSSAARAGSAASSASRRVAPAAVVPPVRYFARSAPSSASTSSARLPAGARHLDVRRASRRRAGRAAPAARLAGSWPAGSAISTCASATRSSRSSSTPHRRRPARPAALGRRPARRAGRRRRGVASSSSTTCSGDGPAAGRRASPYHAALVLPVGRDGVGDGGDRPAGTPPRRRRVPGEQAGEVDTGGDASGSLW